MYTKLLNYIKIHHYEKWRDLTSIGKFGPGMANSIKAFCFVIGKEDLEDPKIAIKKKTIHYCLLYLLFSIILILISFAMILFYAVATNVW